MNRFRLPMVSRYYAARRKNGRGRARPPAPVRVADTEERRAVAEDEGDLGE